MLAVTHRSQMHRATAQSLLVAIEPASEDVPPHAHTALATTVETRIAVARRFSSTRKTFHQAIIRLGECACDATILYVQQSKYA
jgi:hypothetical protein